MAFVDGELSPARTDQMEEHLAVCTECCELVDRFRAIRESFSTEDLFPEIPKPRHIAAPLPASPGISVPSETVRRATPAVWAAGVALMMTGVLLWQLLAPARVSARELIERARVEESRPLSHVSQPVVQRTLRTTRRVGGVVRERMEYEEIWQGAPGLLTRVRSAAPITREIASSIPVEDCANLAPLSVDMLSCLAGQRQTEVRVLAPPKEEYGAVYQLAIDHLHPIGGNPFTSVWTLRMSDWRLIRVDYRFFAFPEEVTYAVEELHYRVVDALPVASVPAPADPESGAAASSDREPSAARWHDAAVSAMAQRKAALLLALYALELTPEDDVEFAPAPSGALHVRVLVSDGTRRQRFLDVLNGMEGLQADVMTYRDAADEAISVSPMAEVLPHAPSGLLPGASLRSDGPLLFDVLTQHFGGGEGAQEKALAFGASLMESMLTLQFRTGWLERARASILPEEWATLPAADRARLQAMDHEFAETLAAEYRALTARVEAVLCPHYCQDAAEARSLATPGTVADSPEADDVTRFAIGASFPQGGASLSARLQQEFSWLKVLFVDGAYLGDRPNPQNQSERLAQIQRTVANWRSASIAAGSWLRATPHPEAPQLQSSHP